MAVKEKYDFFSIYKLTKYSATSPQYGGFLPIYIQSTQAFAGEGNTLNSDADSENDPKIKFIVPWRSGEISDSVSVAFSRRGDNPIQQQGANLLSQFMSSFNEEAGKWILARYDPSSLNMTLSFDFMLPLISLSAYPSNFVQDVREGLGALKGIVFPRSYGFSYPPLVKVTIGGLYKGFKGFINDVNIRTSEEVVDVNGEMFPLMISGTIRMINVFMYTWNKNNVNIENLGSFNINKDPSILFGMGIGQDSANDMYGSANPGSVINNKSTDEISKIMEDAGLKKETDTKLKESLRNDADAQLESLGIDKDALDSNVADLAGMNPEDMMDSDFAESMYNKYKEISLDPMNTFNDTLSGGALECVGLFSSLTESGGLFDTVKNVLYTAQTSLSKFAPILSVFGASDTLYDIQRVLSYGRAGMSSISAVCSGIDDLYQMGANLAGNSGVSVSLDNVAYLYQNLSNLGTAAQNISNSSDLYGSLYSVTMVGKNISNLAKYSSNLINTTTSTSANPVSALGTASGLSALSTVGSNLSSYKQTYKDMYDAASSLLDSGEINDAEYQAVKKMYDTSRSIDTTYLENIAEPIQTGLTSTVEKLTPLLG